MDLYGRVRYLSMPPTRQNLTQGLFYSGGFREGGSYTWAKTLALLVIGSLSAMWTILAFAKSLGTKPGDLAGHRFTRPKSPVQCESMLVIV